MNHPEPNLTVNVNISNPGQFFACCGLLELANRLWPGTEGWFDVAGQRFCLHAEDPPPTELSHEFIDSFLKIEITNSMTADEVRRRNELSEMSQNQRKQEKLDDEKKALDKLWRESAVLLSSPFDMRIDWFLDDYSGGSMFKTWAGQQSVIDIANAMKESIKPDEFKSVGSDHWFSQRSNDGSVPFNFDAMLGGQGSDLDVGFSRDPLHLSSATRPLVEVLAFVGLQRCRPHRVSKRNLYRYSSWAHPCSPEIAGPVASGSLTHLGVQNFEFSLLYRTKYLKSFLPATPIGVSP